jgi:hypothetical protein
MTDALLPEKSTHARACSGNRPLSDDFRTAPNQANPNPDHYGNQDVWRFMAGATATPDDPTSYNLSLLGDFTPAVRGMDGFEQWHAPNFDLLPSVGLNASGSQRGNWPANGILVGPQGVNPVVVGWRSPVSGTVHVSAEFSDLDPDGGDGIGWFIEQGSTFIASGQLANGGAPQGASLTTNVGMGTTIFFIVDDGGNVDYLNDSTGLSVTISSLPGSTTPTFSDDFDGSSISSTLWNTDVATRGNRWCSDQPGVGTGTWADISVAACHGLVVSPPYGSIAVGGGLASFAAPDGLVFPYVVTGPPSRQPFPSSGDFVLELRMRSDAPKIAGTGVMVLGTPNADPAGSNPPDLFGARVFQIWADVLGLRAEVLGSNSRDCGRPDIEPARCSVRIADVSAFHDYRLEYVAGAYSLFVDGTLVLGPIPSALRPNTIWLGNPVTLWWRDGPPAPWTAFTIDSIRVTPTSIPIPPDNDLPPSIIPPDGAVEGSTLSPSIGVWRNATSYAFTWLRCGAHGCDPVSHDKTYLLRAADDARRIELRVTGVNNFGSTTAGTELTNPVQAAPPLAVHLPVISGTFALGSTLTAGTGVWGGTRPLSYLFEWFRCSNAGPCKTIAGASGPSYIVQSADLGKRLRVRVRVANPAGGTWGASATLPASSNVSPPRTTSLPQLSGTPTVGSTLQAEPGVWSGSPTSSFISYKWRRCSTLAATSCRWIVGATGNQYVLTAADQGMRLRAVATNTNVVLAIRATSLASPIVTP